MKEKFFNLLKFLFFVLAIPVVVTAWLKFSGQLSAVPERSLKFILMGAVVYILIDILLFEWEVVFQFGRKLITSLLGFAPGIGEAVSYLLPIYTVVLCLAYYVFVVLLKQHQLTEMAFMLIGFSVGLHMCMAAKSLKAADSGALKVNYFFQMIWVYLINLVVFSLLLQWLFSDFSSWNFMQESFEAAVEIYKSIYQQLADRGLSLN